MPREKQIEEMANIINEMGDCNAHYYDEYMIKREAFADANAIAKVLYDAGFRKQSEVIDEFVKKLKDTSMTKWDYHEAVDIEEIDRIAAKMKGGEKE